ncbi:HNH endonuclease [Demequina capsici]|uniref:HNH endonuclease signature motif containing protein n=1 Tax=Demequina capsici TaxID=3075620 RepID=A0AA96J712_9MICO|nr:HNH endonuclease signature motif containing protein [Demequina sp. OYTSA14]WNM23533.1 HNH endonuclease signature motif containing protein [Demequina sp. OYTSA14]
MDMLGILLSGVWGALANFWPVLVPLLVVGLVVSFPMLGRGPNSSRRDPWRGFKYGARARVLERAGSRCEGSLFWAWGRCPTVAVEADHVFPHSKGGPTVVSNGQALCKDHNRRKSNMTPPWWYVLALEKRRRGYFPEGEDVRVYAVISESELETHGYNLWRPRG